MTDEAAFHDGYRRALVEVSRLVTDMRDGQVDELGDLLEELDRMIERARCLGRSSLAATSGGDRA
jgi:hypothetical protein